MGRRQTPGRAELRAVWRRVLELSDRDQLTLYRQLGSYLARGRDIRIAQTRGRGAGGGAGDDALRRQSLQLSNCKAPTVEHYKVAAAALRLPVSAQQVIRRWGALAQREGDV